MICGSREGRLFPRGDSRIAPTARFFVGEMHSSQSSDAEAQEGKPTPALGFRPFFGVGVLAAPSLERGVQGPKHREWRPPYRRVITASVERMMNQ